MKSTTIAAHEGFEVVKVSKKGFRGLQGPVPVIAWEIAYDDVLPITPGGIIELNGTHPDCDYALIKGDVVLRGTSGSKLCTVEDWMTSLGALK